VSFVASSVKTDYAMRIAITAGVAPIAAGGDVVTITFASEFKDSIGNPVIPAIVGTQGLYASNVTSTGFTIQLGAGIGAGVTQNFGILVGGGGANAILT